MASAGDGLRQHVLARTGNHAQVLQFDPPPLAEHVRAADPLLAELARDGITVHGGPLSEFLPAPRSRWAR